MQQWDYKCVWLPDKEVPPEFTHRAKGNSITIPKRTFSAFSRVMACLLLSPLKELTVPSKNLYLLRCKDVGEEGEMKISSSFHGPNREVRFLNCIKLDEEARRPIIQESAYKFVCFQGQQVPAEFTHKTTGNSVVTITKGTLSIKPTTTFRLWPQDYS
ncbi:hypothetical protein IGI04_015704 [Brassica rapa subsp. trilocularis]|uniref:SHSP domain-containing protein n=1 Tax=Brassica rapa subsp. trilocularis TaxID=1813537 RepID=A0ABQ7MQW6_BRACM|nr:hypothetical protein IGI04_015704 [Brassica rapa subsp. trilocularis]